MKSPILVALILFVLSSCIEKKISLDFIGQNAAESLTKEVSKFSDIIGVLCDMTWESQFLTL